VENLPLTNQNLNQAFLEIKRKAFLFENSKDPAVLDELLALIRQVDIEVFINEFHIPYEAEA